MAHQPDSSPTSLDLCLSDLPKLSTADSSVLLDPFIRLSPRHDPTTRATHNLQAVHPKAKRMRRHSGVHERHFLDSIYAKVKRPDTMSRDRIARALHWPERSVRVWFQNMRQKDANRLKSGMSVHTPSADHNSLDVVLQAILQFQTLLHQDHMRPEPHSTRYHTSSTPSALSSTADDPLQNTHPRLFPDLCLEIETTHAPLHTDPGPRTRNHTFPSSYPSTALYDPVLAPYSDVAMFPLASPVLVPIGRIPVHQLPAAVHPFRPTIVPLNLLVHQHPDPQMWIRIQMPIPGTICSPMAN